MICQVWNRADGWKGLFYEVSCPCIQACTMCQTDAACFAGTVVVLATNLQHIVMSVPWSGGHTKMQQLERMACNSLRIGTCHPPQSTVTARTHHSQVDLKNTSPQLYIRDKWLVGLLHCSQVSPSALAYKLSKSFGNSALVCPLPFDRHEKVRKTQNAIFEVQYAPQHLHAWAVSAPITPARLLPCTHQPATAYEPRWHSVPLAADSTPLCGQGAIPTHMGHGP